MDVKTWKVKMGDDQRIDVFHNKCLRRILKIKREDHVATRELLAEKAQTKLLSEEIKRRIKMEDDRACPTTKQKHPYQHHGHLKEKGREEGLRAPGEEQLRERGTVRDGVHWMRQGLL